MKRVMHIHNKTGDTQVDLEADVDLAQELFDEAIAAGKFAYEQVDGKNYHVREFNPDAERIVIISRQVGG